MRDTGQIATESRELAACDQLPHLVAPRSPAPGEATVRALVQTQFRAWSSIFGGLCARQFVAEFDIRKCFRFLHRLLLNEVQ